MRPTTMLTTLGAGALAALLLSAASAWACVGLASITVSDAPVKAGSTLQVTGKEFVQKVPVLIHLDSLTGPVLATVPPPTSTMTSKFTVDVPIPADTAEGQHALIATQEGAFGMNGSIPARTVVNVGKAAPPVVAPDRPAAVLVEAGLGLGVLLLIGLAVCLAALLLAGLVLKSTAGHGDPAGVAA